ncbi:MAG: SemiSWEET family transporter [bacterium]|nr:SemiSWEET family transporter [bacterium]
MDKFQIVAMIAGIMVVFSTLPQVSKTLKTKKVEELSLAMFLLLLGAQTIWFFYGFHIHDIAIILTNGISALVVATNVGLILKYRKVPVKK